jgi:hypothetical protein
VNTIPSHDVVLRRVVDRVAEREQPETPEDLAASLRPLYPKVAVVERQLSGERPSLYVFRDGRYEPERADRWWEGPGVACARLSFAGAITWVSEGWSDLTQTDASEAVGRSYLEFLPPGSAPVAMAMLEALRQNTEVKSEALVVLPGGISMPIEFRAVLEGDDIYVCYRPLDPES